MLFFISVKESLYSLIGSFCCIWVLNNHNIYKELHRTSLFPSLYKLSLTVSLWNSYAPPGLFQYNDLIVNWHLLSMYIILNVGTCIICIAVVNGIYNKKMLKAWICSHQVSLSLWVKPIFVGLLVWTWVYDTVNVLESVCLPPRELCLHRYEESQGFKTLQCDMRCSSHG